jgi:hypothetical protein
MDLDWGVREVGSINPRASERAHEDGEEGGDGDEAECGARRGGGGGGGGDWSMRRREKGQLY